MKKLMFITLILASLGLTNVCLNLSAAEEPVVTLEDLKPDEVKYIMSTLPDADLVAFASKAKWFSV